MGQSYYQATAIWSAALTTGQDTGVSVERDRVNFS